MFLYLLFLLTVKGSYYLCEISRQTMTSVTAYVIMKIRTERNLMKRRKNYLVLLSATMETLEKAGKDTV